MGSHLNDTVLLGGEVREIHGAYLNDRFGYGENHGDTWGYISMTGFGTRDVRDTQGETS